MKWAANSDAILKVDREIEKDTRLVVKKSIKQFVYRITFQLTEQFQTPILGHKEVINRLQHFQTIFYFVIKARYYHIKSNNIQSYSLLKYFLLFLVYGKNIYSIDANNVLN